MYVKTENRNVLCDLISYNQISQFDNLQLNSTTLLPGSLFIYSLKLTILPQMTTIKMSVA